MEYRTRTKEEEMFIKGAVEKRMLLIKDMGDDTEFLKAVVDLFFEANSMEVEPEIIDELYKLIDEYPFTASTSYKQKSRIVQAILDAFIIGQNTNIKEK